MGITHFSGLSVTSGTSFSAVDAGLITSSGISMLGAGQISLRTVANASSLGTTELGIVFQASGVSLIYRSDDTAYTVGASAVSVAL